MHKRMVMIVVLCTAWPIAASAQVQPAQGQPARLSPDQAAAQVDARLSGELFQSSAEGTAALAPPTDDQTFLRRVTLDLTGKLPTPAEVTAFSLDPSGDKRTRAVSNLLSRPDYGRNWGRYWRDVILYRRADDRALLAARSIEDYLADQFSKSAGWNEIARTFITATGDVQVEGKTGIIFAQMGETAEITAEMSRIFLGIQIQCAQCHDHPTDRWKRQQFHELAAFFPRIGLRPVRTTERRSFEVVGRDFAGRSRPMGMMRRGELEHFMPDLQDPTAQGTLMTPTFFVNGQTLPAGQTDGERRATIAAWMTDPSNVWFARAAVNRLWSELVGEGFYEPVDDLGPDRQCSAPLTLDYLAGEFAARGYDMKWLMATITGTQAYQRQCRPRRNPGETPFTANCAQRLRSDQVYDAVFGALGLDPEQSGPPMARGQGPYRLGGPRMQFAATFGYDPSDPRQEVTGSIPQALMLMNSRFIAGTMNGRNSGNSLGKLLASTADDEQVAVELYLRCLAREPKQAELVECLDYVREIGNRQAAFEDLTWALINSAEFLYRN